MERSPKGVVKFVNIICHEVTYVTKREARSGIHEYQQRRSRICNEARSGINVFLFAAKLRNGTKREARSGIQTNFRNSRQFRRNRISKIQPIFQKSAEPKRDITLIFCKLIAKYQSNIPFRPISKNL